MNRVSRKQKRVRSNTKSQPRAARAEKNLIAKALHLLLDGEHFVDRAAAERLRQFPSVPRKRVEVDELRGKLKLFDKVVSLLGEVLVLPGVGKIARKITTLWSNLKAVAPEIGLVNVLESIESIRSVKLSKIDPSQDKPAIGGEE